MKRKREIIKKLNVIIKIVLFISKFLPRKFYIFLFNFVRNLNGYLPMFIRFVCLKRCAKSCGDNVAIFPNVYIFNIDKLMIGDNVSIHEMCYIDASGTIKIGNNVSIAHSTSILSEEHVYSSLDVNIKDQGYEKKLQ